MTSAEVLIFFAPDRDEDGRPARTGVWIAQPVVNGHPFIQQPPTFPDKASAVAWADACLALVRPVKPNPA